MTLSDCRRTLEQALDGAGRVLGRDFGHVKKRYKGPSDIVTRADLESQRLILSLLRRRFPDHDFLAEEKASRQTGAEFCWVVDPLDGTTNYAHGYPVACVSIGLVRRGRPVLAGIEDPFRKERFLAQEGRGATMNGRPLRVSRSRRLSESLLVTGFPYDRARRAAYYVEFYRSFIERCHDVRRSGSAALDLAWVAAGRVDGFWELSLKPWDVAAGSLLVREAGGVVSDFSGRPWNGLLDFGRQTLATNGRIHRQMRGVLAALVKERR